MAQRRMFSKHVTDSDAFMDMPASTQALYFHLNMAADDDGFVNAPNRIVRTVGGSADDLKLLIVKRFILTFDSGIIVIKHWRLHNYIQNDRRKSTVYHEERAMLEVDKNGSYTEKCIDGYRMDTDCIQGIDALDTQDRLGKDSIGEVSIGKDNIDHHLEIVSGKDKANSTQDDDNDDDGAFDRSEIVSAFERAFAPQTVSPVIADDIDYYLTKESMEKDLIIKAIEEASMRNAKSWAYIKKMLDGLLSGGIRTIQAYNNKKREMEASKKAHQEKQKPSSSGHKAGAWQPDRPGSKYADIYKN